MCKMMDLYLKDMTEDYDFLGKIGVDAVSVEPVVKLHGSRKPANRAERRKATAYAKLRRQELANDVNGLYVYINKKGKVFDLGTKGYGKKHYSRKIRYQRFEEPIAEAEVVGVTVAEEKVFYPGVHADTGEFMGYRTYSDWRARKPMFVADVMSQEFRKQFNEYNTARYNAIMADYLGTLDTMNAMTEYLKNLTKQVIDEFGGFR